MNDAAASMVTNTSNPWLPTHWGYISEYYSSYSQKPDDHDRGNYANGQKLTFCQILAFLLCWWSQENSRYFLADIMQFSMRLAQARSIQFISIFQQANLNFKYTLAYM